MKSTFQPFFLLSLIICLSFPNAVAQFSETGQASYYNNNLHGKRTSSGERYDKNKFTCAHKTLPFGTVLRVTRLDNNQRVQVRVNDRGPFAQGRIVDLSFVAAEQIGLIRAGITQVKIEVIGSNPSTSSPPPISDAGSTIQSDESSTSSNETRPDLSDLPLRDHTGQLLGEKRNESGSGNVMVQDGFVMEKESFEPQDLALQDAEKHTPSLFHFVAFTAESEGYAIQVGAYFNYYKLLKAMDDIARKGISNTMVQSSLKGGKPVFRILVGPYSTRSEADQMKGKLSAKKYKGIVVDLSALE